MTSDPSSLERRLDELALPTRVASWAARRGVETLGQLVRWHPNDLRREKNMGRTSIAAIREVIRAECGAEWEDLWRAAREGDVDAGDAELPDVDWDSLAHLLPEWLLGAPLDGLGLPARMLGYAAREGIVTVGDLVRRSRVELARAKNLGRGTIDVTRTIVAGAAMAGPQPRATEAPSSWDRLSSTLPNWLLAMSLAHLDLPARMRSYAEREGHVTVADLVGVPAATLRRAPNLGRGSVKDTHELLREHASNPPLHADEYESFWALWLARLAGLGSIDRLVITQRSGIAGDSRTLLEIGDMLGVSRERVRQIESRAIQTVARGSWVADVCARLARSLDGGAMWLDALEAADGWFGPMNDDRREPFVFFLERIARGALSIAPIDGRDVIAACSEGEMIEACARARAALESLPCPAERATMTGAIAAVMPESAPGLARLLEEALEERVHRDELGRMVAFGTGRDAEVIAFLRKCPEPVTIHEVFAGLGLRV